MRAFSRWPWTVFTLTILCLPAAGAWFYHAQEKRVREGVETDLLAITRLKTDRIAQWRAERLTDANILSDSPYFAMVVAQWLSEPQSEIAENLLDQFRSLCSHYNCFNIQLVDSNGKVLLSIDGNDGPLHEETARTLATALRERRTRLSKIHAGPTDPQPHIDAIAPLFLDSGEDARAIAAIVLQSDAQRFLYPLIQSWPVPSDSAECLLVQRDGDAVLFLNDLRHQKNTGMKLRIPLNRRDLPVVMAVEGKEGVFHELDYRGVKVVSVLQAIPDSPWFILDPSRNY